MMICLVVLTVKQVKTTPFLFSVSFCNINCSLGRVDDFYFFDCFSSFCFLLIEFHLFFSIYYKILTNNVYYYCSLIRIVQAVGTSFFCRARFISFHTHASLFTLFVYSLFHSCCFHARVFRKTLLYEFHISYSHTEWYLFFPIVLLQVHNVYSERKTRNS